MRVKRQREAGWALLYSWKADKILLCVLLILLAAGRVARADTNTAGLYLDALVDFERHAETIWHDATYAKAPTSSGYWGDGNSGGNGGIRGSSGVALAYAVLVRALPDDPKNTVRIDRIRKALNYAANTHLSGPSTNVCVDNNRWGHDWQTSEWAGSMGLACVLMQTNLPAATVQACQRAIADEATYRAAIAPASGYVGDSKAEENGWNSNVLALGAAWLNSHSNAPTWLMAAKKYLANTYTVADTTGDPLAAWVTTVTLYPSYAMQNHGFYHPTYQMVSGMSMGDSFLMARMANPAIATQLKPFAEHNVLNAWNQLKSIVMDSGEFAYPSGLDWALHDYEQNSYCAWLATHFNDPLARWADNQLAKLVRYRQMVNGDGRFVGESESNAFYREAVEAKRTAIAWLHHSSEDFPFGLETAPAPVIQHFPDVELITQRGPFGFFSLSYGARIMGLVEAPTVSIPTNVYVTTPRLPGILGLGALGNPTSAELINFSTNANGFDAEFYLQHGSQGVTRVYVKSTGETLAMVEVPWPVMLVFSTQAGSFSVGVENDPLTGGSRLVEWAGGSVTVTNRSNVTRNITNDWVCVDGRYGMAAGPEGYFSYKAAGSYNRLGAAQDTLEYVPQDQLGARYAVWFPAKSGVQTASGAGAISWNVSGTNGVLTFPGLGGTLQQIVVGLPSAPPAYAPYVVPVASVTGSSQQAGYPPTNATDGNANTFWVSSGTVAGQGPTESHPEWLDFTFPRIAGVMGVNITPRANYGPKNIQVLIGTNVLFTGTMTSGPLAIRVNQPIDGNTARLLITSSFDPSFPNNSRNVQVVQVDFLERAIPGTFGDWVLETFSDEQLVDPEISGAAGDPDGDGVRNLAEFATGGNPFMADAAGAIVQPLKPVSGMFGVQFRERKNLGNVQYRFERSSDLVNWTEVTPSFVITVANLSQVYVKEARFVTPIGGYFYRVRYLQSEL